MRDRILAALTYLGESVAIRDYLQFKLRKMFHPIIGSEEGNHWFIFEGGVLGIGGVGAMMVSVCCGIFGIFAKCNSLTYLEALCQPRQRYH